jgi:hypothetical protein
MGMNTEEDEFLAAWLRKQGYKYTLSKTTSVD